MPRNLNGFIRSRVPQNRRAARGFRVEFFHGTSPRIEFFAWSHYDLACDYLQCHGLALNDVGEVLVNFDELELRELIEEAR